MKKRSCLFIPLLLSTWIVPSSLYAKKPAASHPASPEKTTADQSSKTQPNTQDESISLPKINQIRFSGNTKISSETLAKNIPLKANDIANEHIIMDSMIKIAQLYKEQNIKITITPVIEKTTINSRNIEFDIHEMPTNGKQD